jgi:hypothetical protein
MRLTSMWFAIPRGWAFSRGATGNELIASLQFYRLVSLDVDSASSAYRKLIYNSMTLTEIAEDFGVANSQVSWVCAKAISSELIVSLY